MKNDNITKLQANAINILTKPMKTDQNTQKSNNELSTYSNLEDRIKTLNTNYDSTMKTFEMKFITLKDHLNKLKERIEVNQLHNDNHKSEVLEDLRSIENQIKVSISKEKELFCSIIDSNKVKLQSQIKFVSSTIDIDSNQMNKEIIDQSNQASNILKSIIEEEVDNRQVVASSIDEIKCDIKSKIESIDRNLLENNQDTNIFYVDKKQQMREINIITQKHLLNEKENRNTFKTNIDKVLLDISDYLNQ